MTTGVTVLATRKGCRPLTFPNGRAYRVAFGTAAVLLPDALAVLGPARRDHGQHARGRGGPGVHSCSRR
ncbi:hypothetical protein [Nonomuraea aridisoli]|uniref:Uncharacterized protein n=1 Tax=Nonomuraea aridisoli TaxID=2070368 RepID=A0A2W2E6U7_9ACTN|nr:hypothetical protein [Nonomuraea aridisoli]PZG18101.1 hypothetical protein C1J01_16135 [Nonomuraea aridisoli]